MNQGSAGLAPAFRAINAQPLAAAGMSGFGAALSPAPRAIQDVVLHHLRTRDEIDSVVFLRDEIDLSVHTAAGAAFETLEKKETSADSCSVSSSMASGSAPSASCPWATSSP